MNRLNFPAKETNRSKAFYIKELFKMYFFVTYKTRLQL